ncbi:amidase [Paracoccus pacificus]|uniref:Amidase n=1 Tax=Paracoccus pacificus TaxID=1463598 RepID=A0ABW4R7H3_9RHOB
MRPPPPASGLATLSATETVAMLTAGRITAVDRIRASLERIAVVQPLLNAFTAVFADEAMALAAALDRRIAAGEVPGPLAGVPVAIKDFTPSKGHPATRGSWAISDQPGNHDPVIIRRLKAAGAIIVAKTTTPEFAYSGFTQSPRWGVTRHPLDPARSPGGSSGGAAVAVATDCVPLAEGTDMGGSIRIPAAFCGVVGLKPSLGRIPMDILPGNFDDMAHFGPLARDVRDAVLFLQVTQGPDQADIMSLTARAPMPLGPVSLRGRRFALSVDLGYYRVHPGVETAVQAAADELGRAGAKVVNVSLPWSRSLNDLWGQIWAVTLAAAWGDALVKERDRMDPKLVALMEEARKMDAVTFKRLEVRRTRYWHDFARVLDDCDAFLCPTCAQPAPLIADAGADHDQTGPDGLYRGLDMTCPFNLLSPCPAISLPVGDADDLPVGLQVVGQRQADGPLLALAWAIETALRGPSPPPEAARVIH